jgi:TonB family protein
MYRKMICIAALLPLAAVLAMGAGEVRVSMEDAMKNAVNKPKPAYSPMAQQMKVVGKVEVEATVTTDGAVEAVKVISGNPLLSGTVVTAVKQWKFTPFTSGGEPARAIAVLTFDFQR